MGDLFFSASLKSFAEGKGFWVPVSAMAPGWDENFDSRSS